MKDFVTAEDVREVLAGKESRAIPSELQPREISYLLVQLRYDTFLKLSSDLGDLVRLVRHRRGMVEAAMSSILLVTFPRLLDNKQGLSEAIKQLINDISSRFAAEAKVVRGDDMGVCGLIGHDQDVYLGSLLPSLERNIGRLALLEFGAY